MEMWEALFIPVAGAGGLLVSVLWKRNQQQGWNKTVSDLGLAIVDQSMHSWSWIWLEARDETLTVRLESPRRKGEHGTRIAVTHPGWPGGSADLRIRGEKIFQLRLRELEIGDKAFDNAFSIEGPVPLVASLLDAEVRSLITQIDATSHQFEIVGREIGLRVTNEAVPIVLPLLLDLGRRFARAEDTAHRLAGNSLQDPQAGVRLLNLRLLAREFPAEGMTGDTLRQACADPSPEVRLQAATGLGDEGRGALLELAERMVDDACSAQAVRNLGEALPFDRARDLLLAALRWRRTRTALACMEALGRSGEAAAVDALAEVLEREIGELAAAAALALKETGRGEAEPPLVQALRSEESEVRMAAVRALGQVGSATAVLPLKEVEESSLLDREQRRAARQSIAEIQARLPGASPGQLSLAGAGTGQLSLAEAETGQLSLPVDPAGQLSLPESEKPQRPG
jgi:HEAT repeat protein